MSTTILSKEFNSEHLGAYVAELNKAYASVCTPSYTRKISPTNKESLIARFPSPVGFDFAIEDEKIEILGDLTPDQIEKLAHMFHIMGITNFTFAANTKRDFGSAFQKSFNKEAGRDDSIAPPKYERKDNKNKAESSTFHNMPLNVATSSMAESVSKLGKTNYHDAKIKYGLNGKIGIKVYPNKEAMEKSGLMEDGKPGKQNWQFYIEATPYTKNGVNGVSFAYAMPDSDEKGINETYATEYITGPAKDAGITHLHFSPKILHNDNGPLITACAKKHIIPIMPVDKAVFYANIYLNTLDSETKGDGEPGKMPKAKRLELQKRLLAQINENLIKEGLKVKANPEMYPVILDIEERIAINSLKQVKKSSKTGKNYASPELTKLTEYSGPAIRKIIKTIDGLEAVDISNQLELKETLSRHIEASGSADPSAMEQKRLLDISIVEGYIKSPTNPSFKSFLKEYTPDTIAKLSKAINESPGLTGDDNRKTQLRIEMLRHMKLVGPDPLSTKAEDIAILNNIRDFEFQTAEASLKSLTDPKFVPVISKYTADDVGKLREAIENNKNIPWGDKYNLKRQIVDQIDKKNPTPDASLKSRRRALKMDIDIYHDAYYDTFYGKIKEAIEKNNAEDVYVAIKATASVLKEMQINLEKDTPLPFDFEKIYDLKVKSGKLNTEFHDLYSTIKAPNKLDAILKNGAHSELTNVLKYLNEDYGITKPIYLTPPSTLKYTPPTSTPNIAPNPYKSISEKDVKDRIEAAKNAARKEGKKETLTPSTQKVVSKQKEM